MNPTILVRIVLDQGLSLAEKVEPAATPVLEAVRAVVDYPGGLEELASWAESFLAAKRGA